jgi:hypothetical protein
VGLGDVQSNMCWFFKKVIMILNFHLFPTSVAELLHNILKVLCSILTTTWKEENK